MKGKPEKEKYIELSKADKTRYESESGQFIVKPFRGVSLYMCYCRKNKSDVVKQGFKGRAAIKKLGAMWKELKATDGVKDTDEWKELEEMKKQLDEEKKKKKQLDEEKKKKTQLDDEKKKKKFIMYVGRHLDYTITGVSRYEFTKEVGEVMVGTLTTEDVIRFDKSLKTFPFGKHADARKYAKAFKTDNKSRMGLLTIQPKIDSKKQRRVQCGINQTALKTCFPTENPAPGIQHLVGEYVGNSCYKERQGHGFVFEDNVITALGLRKSYGRTAAWDAYDENGTPVSIKCIKDGGTIDCGSAPRMFKHLQND